MTSSLRGKRIILTRSTADSAATRDWLQAVGAYAIILPANQYVECDDARAALEAVAKRLDTVDWIVFSSRNAVAFFEALFPNVGLVQSADTRIAAVGPKTAEAVQNLGLDIDAVPKKFTGEHLAQALGDLTGRHVLLPRSAKGRPELLAALKAQGAVVTEIALYNTVMQPTNVKQLDLLQGWSADAILFASPSAIRHFLASAAGHFLQAQENFPVVGCIGPTTAEAARQAGLTVAVMPTTYTMEALVEALSEFYDD